MKLESESISAGILAGGEGRRLGGVDKGWVEVDGRPLIEHTIARVKPQCGRILISANRSLARYRALGYGVYADDEDDYRGPLAGIASILRAASTPYVLIVPVDTPYLPTDLAARLAAAMQPSTQLASVIADDRPQPLHALMRRDVLDDLEAALFENVRAVRDWHAGLDCVQVRWDSGAAFANINTPDDVAAPADDTPE